MLRTVDGYPVRPELKTIHVLIVRNMYCDSFSTLEGMSQEEVLAKWQDGHDRRIYGDIVEGETRQGYDPEEWAAYRHEVNRIYRTSCYMPPPEDLLLLAAAKRTAPEDYEKIDPDKASWRKTRDQLRVIRQHLLNEYRYGFPRPQTPTP